MITEAHPSLLRVLRGGAWFASLPAPQQEAIVRGSVLRSYKKGRVISLEDSPPKGLYVVLEGRVRIARTLAGGDEVLLHIGEPGFWFGDFAVITGRRTIASVIADSDVRTLMLSKARFDRIVADEPHFYKGFVSLIADRFAVMIKFLAEAHLLAPEDRLRARLVDALEYSQREHIQSGPVALNLSQSDLAGMVGVSRQTLNELLKRLQAQGLIEVGFRRIRVTDPARLRSSQFPVPAKTIERARAR
jgi:CRP/FNR family transcriptional regulator, cyclic AMP receptor protein